MLFEFCVYESLEFCWQSRFKQLEHKPVPFWVALFVEGTRFTHTKLLAAQEFAISRGMTVPKNVLIPRTKVITALIIRVCLVRRKRECVHLDFVSLVDIFHSRVLWQLYKKREHTFQPFTIAHLQFQRASLHLHCWEFLKAFLLR